MITPPLLVRWYGTLAVVTTLLATQALVMPRWPASPSPLPGQQLKAGLRAAKLLPSTDHPPGSLWPAKRSYERSTSAPVVIPLREGFELTLMTAVVRQRFNLQTSFIGEDQPSLKLLDRRLIATPTPTAAGQIQDRPALQTCLVRGQRLGDAFGVTRDQLTPLSDRLSNGKVATLERLIGLKPNRTYACTLISLRWAKGKPPSDRLWQQVLGQVEPVLQSHN